MISDDYDIIQWHFARTRTTEISDSNPAICLRIFATILPHGVVTPGNL